MSTTLLDAAPDAVRAYLTLTQAGAHGAASVAFADDAQVTDDGQTHVGRAAIRAWLTRTPAELTYTVTPLRLVTDAAVTTLTSRVEGNFPSGLVELTYTFTLEAGVDTRISRLEITNADAHAA